MPDQTSQYRTNHVTFALPTRLKDKTVHMFTLNDSGPSDFSVVISHADAGPDETLADFKDRLLQELEKSLPKFHHAGTREREIDGAPAIELAYSWRSEGKFLHQRQLITLLPGAVAGTRTAMMIGATCLRAFNDEWKAAFEGILGSMKLRHPPAQETAPATGVPANGVPATGVPATAAPAPAEPAVFAVSERRRSLHAFADRDEACRKIDAREVEQDAWAFFDAAGNPLHANFVVPNSGTVWRKAGTYVLEARPGSAGPGLRDSLGRVTVFVQGSPEAPFDSIAAVQAHLDKLAGA